MYGQRSRSGTGFADEVTRTSLGSAKRSSESPEERIGVNVERHLRSRRQADEKEGKQSPKLEVTPKIEEMGFRSLKMAIPPEDNASYPKLPPHLWRINRKNVATTWVYLAEERLDEFRALMSEGTAITQIRSFVEDLVHAHLGERNPISAFSRFSVRWVKVGDDAGRITRDEPGDTKQYGKLVGYSISARLITLKKPSLNGARWVS